MTAKNFWRKVDTFMSVLLPLIITWFKFSQVYALYCSEPINGYLLFYRIELLSLSWAKAKLRYVIIAKYYWIGIILYEEACC